MNACSGPKGFVGPNPPAELAERVHRIWVDFACDGTLPWPEYEKVGDPVYALELGRVIEDPPIAAAKWA
jgi:para-nitrobenzyl esterase